MKRNRVEGKSWAIPRRRFLGSIGATAVGVTMVSSKSRVPIVTADKTGAKRIPIIRGAFVYPPTEQLRKEGYYSWPGSSFDAEGRQRQYLEELDSIAAELSMQIAMEDHPLDSGETIERFIDHVKRSPADGLFLVPFKKSHWEHVVRIVEETGIPTVILATLGVLLIGHVREMARRPGVSVISSQDNFEAVRNGFRMMKTACWMRDALILNIAGSTSSEHVVPVIGTKVRNVPHEEFYRQFGRMKQNDAVSQLANTYWDNAEDIVEPTKNDVLEAAKAYFVFKDLLEMESADAIMMDCLPGLKRPHKHVPPCMGFMSLRDEGVPMGCESDLDATLTLMLLQQLFGKPGFQHNPSVDTEKNHYFCAHCTSASRMNGLDQPSEPFILRNHAEAGWGCVPRVLMKEGQDVTIAKYLSCESGGRPQMLVYSGSIVGCPPIPPTGGCRTNVETTINELDEVYELKGHHLSLIYGDYAKQLSGFCQLFDIEVVV